MILPEHAEELTDEELVQRLVEEGVYDQDTAEALVQALRHPKPGDPPLR